MNVYCYSSPVFMNDNIDVCTFYANFNWSADRIKNDYLNYKIGEPKPISTKDDYTFLCKANNDRFSVFVLTDKRLKIKHITWHANNLDAICKIYVLACAAIQSDINGNIPSSLNDDSEVAFAYAVNSLGSEQHWYSPLTRRNYYITIKPVHENNLTGYFGLMCCKSII